MKVSGTSLSILGAVMVSMSLSVSLLGSLVRAASVRPPLDGGRVRTFVAAHREDVRRACWTSDRAHSAARVKLSLDVDGDGRVKSAGIVEMDGDRAVGLCVRKVAKRWEFPASAGGGRFVVPFELTDDES